MISVFISLMELLPFPAHPYLGELVEFKRKMGQKMEKYFWNEKQNLLAMDSKAQKLNERLLLYQPILMSEPHYFLLNQKENFISEKSIIFKDTKDITLSRSWLL